MAVGGVQESVHRSAVDLRRTAAIAADVVCFVRVRGYTGDRDIAANDLRAVFVRDVQHEGVFFRGATFRRPFASDKIPSPERCPRVDVVKRLQLYRRVRVRPRRLLRLFRVVYVVNKENRCPAAQLNVPGQRRDRIFDRATSNDKHRVVFFVVSRYRVYVEVRRVGFRLSGIGRLLAFYVEIRDCVVFYRLCFTGLWGDHVFITQWARFGT